MQTTYWPGELLLHERVSIYLDDALRQDRLSVVAQVIELTVFLCIGFAALIIFVVTYRRSDPAARRVALIGLGIMVLLAVCAVGVDFVHSILSIIFKLPSEIDTFFVLLEDGGEMITISLGLAFSFATFTSLKVSAPNGAAEHGFTAEGRGADLVEDRNETIMTVKEKNGSGE